LLINKFVLKLADSNIRQWTHRVNPTTYNAAMTAASNEAASQSILAHEAGTGGKGNIAINAFGGRCGACPNAAASTTMLLLVLSLVQTVITTKTNLEVEVSLEGAKAVADA
jgi:hypothetical protein